MAKPEQGPRRNDEVQSSKPIRVIGPNGDQLGIMLVTQAQMKAQELGLDLVEVSPNATPIVCKIMDWGKHIYQTQKKTKKSSQNTTKELRLKPRIGQHDLDVKLGKARKFLAEGNRVQFTMIFKGRELAHKELGEEVLGRVKVALEEEANVEQQPWRTGRSIQMTLSPSRKKAKVKESPA